MAAWRRAARAAWLGRPSSTATRGVSGAVNEAGVAHFGRAARVAGACTAGMEHGACAGAEAEQFDARNERMGSSTMR